MSELPEVETVLEILDSAKLHISRIGMEMAREAVHTLAQRLADAEETLGKMSDDLERLGDRAFRAEARAERAERERDEARAATSANEPAIWEQLSQWKARAERAEAALREVIDKSVQGYLITMCQAALASTPTEEPEHGA